MYDVITIGTATRDVFLRSDAFKHVKDAEHLTQLGFKTGEAECVALGSKIEVSELHQTFGGGAVNSAVTFARQGYTTGAVVKVGADADGAGVIERLTTEGVTPFQITDPEQATAYSAILLLPGGERTILVYRGAAARFSQDELNSQNLSASWLYVVPSNIPFEVLFNVITAAKASGAKIAFNPSRFYLEMGQKTLRPLLEQLDVVLVNREEGSYLTGVPYDDERGIFRVFDELVPGIAVMTEGPQGSMVSDGKTLYRAGIYQEREKVDRTGAGDAFGSGFVAGLMRNTDIEEALRYASANATAVVEHLGAHEGALTQNAFQDARFKDLTITTESLT